MSESFPLHRQLLNCLAAALLCAAPAMLHGAQAIPVYQARVIETYPHDSGAFTQGLTVADGRLYEGTGRNGESSLRQVELETGTITKRHNLSRRYFGEGITVMGDRIYQLTWRSNTGFIYDLGSFDVLESFYLPGEGWGLTHDGTHLIVSDGSATLRFLDPDSLREVRRVRVRDNAGPVDDLNELEYIDGEVWANVWYRDYILRIDPDTGAVNSRVDLRDLYPSHGSEAVLNGIAWDREAGRLFVTGKLWPTLFEIEVLD